MNEALLKDEYRAALGAVTPRQLKWIAEEFKVSERAWDIAGGWGYGFVLPNEDGTYEPARYWCECAERSEVHKSGAIGCVINPVFSYDFAASYTGLGCAPALEDLCAWNPRDPEEWWVRVGGSDIGPVFLGSWHATRAFDRPPEGQEERRAPLHLHPSPHAWLQAECEGAVFLHGGGALWREVFREVRRLYITDPEFAEFVYKALRERRPESLPEISVPNEEAA